jgi:hypothetical protein
VAGESEAPVPKMSTFATGMPRYSQFLSELTPFATANSLPTTQHAHQNKRDLVAWSTDDDAYLEAKTLAHVLLEVDKVLEENDDNDDLPPLEDILPAELLNVDTGGYSFVGFAYCSKAHQ